MVEIKRSTPNLDRIEKEMKYLEKHGVKIGVLGQDTNEEGVTIKEYATYLILGTSTMPSRDFMNVLRDRKGRMETIRLQKTLLRKVFRGEITGKQCLEQLGIHAVQRLKLNIIKGDFAPLKQSTIDRKTRNKNNILRDSDSLLNSLAFEVVKL